MIFCLLEVWSKNSLSANKCLEEKESKNKEGAIEYFRRQFPLDDMGYYKEGEKTYVVAEQIS